jgi:hypothetical protein
MSAAILVAFLLLAASPGEAETRAETSAAVETTVRPPHELRKAVSDALKRSAPASNPDPYAVAPDLIDLYEELRADTRIEQFDRKRLRGLVRTRLDALARQLEKESARPQNVKGRGDVLAQQGLPPAAGFGAGGPNAGGIAGPQAGPPDNGQLLVDLIKRTIAPTTWDDAGGPGSIYYYRPLRVLVIRQTGEIHERIGGALGGLRGK